MERMIELQAKDGHRLSVYRAVPNSPARGTIVVLQEIWGVNRHIRSVADGYAADGYVALAPALFDRVERGLAMDEYSNETRTKGSGVVQKLKIDEALLDIAATVESGAGDGKVGVVGFCFGGRMAWLAASRLDGLSAAAAYYGGGIPGLAAEHSRCPVIFHFGERDAHIPAASVAEFGKAHPELPIYMYAADHGFNCDQRPSWDAAAAKLARERTIDFFRKHVG
jgi:carboxymethylenebutenolidase